jgi:hypothetical protein
VDSTFLHDVKNFFHATENIQELIDPYVNFSFVGQQVFYNKSKYFFQF